MAPTQRKPTARTQAWPSSTVLCFLAACMVLCAVEAGAFTLKTPSIKGLLVEVDQGASKGRKYMQEEVSTQGGTGGRRHLQDGASTGSGLPSNPVADLVTGTLTSTGAAALSGFPSRAETSSTAASSAYPWRQEVRAGATSAAATARQAATAATVGADDGTGQDDTFILGTGNPDDAVTGRLPFFTRQFSPSSSSSSTSRSGPTSLSSRSASSSPPSSSSRPHPNSLSSPSASSSPSSDSAPPSPTTSTVTSSTPSQLPTTSTLTPSIPVSSSTVTSSTPSQLPSSLYPPSTSSTPPSTSDETIRSLNDAISGALATIASLSRSASTSRTPSSTQTTPVRVSDAQPDPSQASSGTPGGNQDPLSLSTPSSSSPSQTILDQVIAIGSAIGAASNSPTSSYTEPASTQASPSTSSVTQGILDQITNAVRAAVISSLATSTATQTSSSSPSTTQGILNQIVAAAGAASGSSASTSTQASPSSTSTQASSASTSTQASPSSTSTQSIVDQVVAAIGAASGTPTSSSAEPATSGIGGTSAAADALPSPDTTSSVINAITSTPTTAGVPRDSQGSLPATASPALTTAALNPSTLSAIAGLFRASSSDAGATAQPDAGSDAGTPTGIPGTPGSRAGGGGGSPNATAGSSTSTPGTPAVSASEVVPARGRRLLQSPTADLRHAGTWSSGTPGDGTPVVLAPEGVRGPRRQLQSDTVMGLFTLNGPSNTKVLSDGSVSLSLTHAGGAGLTSKRAFPYGKFSFDAKLPKGYSAGVCSSFFLINGDYDSRGEWDLEFLGSASDGSAMTLQTNFFEGGVGNHEQLTSFGFDPSAAFHTYTIDWQPSQTVFSVDQKPIRTVRKTSSRYPSSPMTVAVSIWDASQWATGPRDARIPINYDYAPFTATFKNFQYSAYTSSRQG